METFGSENSREWIKVSDLLLGKVKEGRHFTLKHQRNSVDVEGYVIDKIEKRMNLEMYFCSYDWIAPGLR